MNRWVRTELNNIGDKLEELSSELERIRDEEEEKLDNIPESLQDSEKGQHFQDVIDYLDTATTSLEEAREAITDAVGV